MTQRLHRSDLAHRRHGERRLHLAQLLDGLRAAHPIADPQRRHPVDLGEGAKRHHIGALGRLADRAPVVGGGRVLVIGLVHDHQHPLGDPIQQSEHVAGVQIGPAGVVGIADVHQDRVGTDGGQEAVGIQAMIGGERDRHRRHHGVANAQGVHRERGPSEHRLAPRASHRQGDQSDQFARSRSAPQVLGIHPQMRREPRAQPGGAHVGVAVDARHRPRHRLPDFLQRLIGVLVGRHLHHRIQVEPELPRQLGERGPRFVEGDLGQVGT